MTPQNVTAPRGTPFLAAAEEGNPWVTHMRQVVYDNPWIRVSHETVTTPGGSAGIYGVVHFKNLAIGVVPIDDEGHTFLVGQYRYTLGAYSWEIPEGGGAHDTPPVVSAQRELLEETGLTALEWIDLGPIHTSNSVTDEAGYLFMARGLTQGSWAPEDTERLEIRRVPLAQAVAWVMEGHISDSLSIVGLLKAARWLETQG